MSESESQPSSVLFAHHGQDWIAGSERCLLDLVERLDRQRFAPVVLCDAPALADSARALGVPTYCSDAWIGSPDRRLATRSERREVDVLIRRHDVQLIHANDMDPLKVLVPVARSARIPIVAHLHIPLSSSERRASLLHQVTHVVGCGESVLRGVLEDGFPREATSVIFNGVDPQRLGIGNASALRSQLGVPDHAVVAAVVGSLIERKDVATLVDAMALIHSDVPVHLLVIGDGVERDSLQQRASAKGLNDRVHFLGRRIDVGAILRDSADILVSAARQEAFPLNLLEGALFELPVVARDLSPHRESVVVGQTGMLVEVGDAGAFAAALQTLAADASLRGRLGAGGRTRVINHFLTERYVREFTELYIELMNRPSREHGWTAGIRWPDTYNDWIRSAITKRLRIKRPPDIAAVEGIVQQQQ